MDGDGVAVGFSYRLVTDKANLAAVAACSPSRSSSRALHVINCQLIVKTVDSFSEDVCHVNVNAQALMTCQINSPLPQTSLAIFVFLIPDWKLKPWRILYRDPASPGQMSC